MLKRKALLTRTVNNWVKYNQWSAGNCCKITRYYSTNGGARFNAGKDFQMQMKSSNYR
jgi:hypothetical protein